MSGVKFNGFLQEIFENPNFDLVELLQDNLDLSPVKAEALACRIVQAYLQTTANNVEKKRVRLVAERSIGLNQNKTSATYNFESLSNNEFDIFTKWFLHELDYSVYPEKVSTLLGVDYIATKDNLKIAILARKYPKNYVLTDATSLLAQQAKNIYQCEHVIILTTTVFSEQAKLNAEKYGVELWDVHKICEKLGTINQKAEMTIPVALPKYQGTLLDSLLSLAEHKIFKIEKRASEKYDVYFPGVKFPLLTFQVKNCLVTRLVFRVKYNESVGETVGDALISYDKNGARFGPEDAEAYACVIGYLEQFLE